MTGQEVFTWVVTNLEAVYGATLNKHLSENKREFWIIRSKEKGRKIEPYWGDPSREFISAAQNNPVDALAGFAANAGIALGLNVAADVLILSDGALLGTQQELEPILLHELCHYVTDSYLNPEFASQVSVDERRVGNVLYGLTDKENEDVTRHTQLFCCMLVRAARLFSDQHNEYSCAEVIRGAMAHDANFTGVSDLDLTP